MTTQATCKLLFAGASAETMHGAIEHHAGFDLKWTVNETGEMLRLTEQEHPDMVILSHGMARANLVPSIRALVERSPATRILVISRHNDSRLALRAFMAGASGFMIEDRAFEELPAALETIRAGENYLSPGIAGEDDATDNGDLAPPPEDAGAADGRVPALWRKAGDRLAARPPRALVVDDEEAIRKAFTTLLEQAGCRVVPAATADEAIAEMKREAPDIAFVDLVMPGGSGVQVIRAIRELDDTLPVIVVTGYPDSELMDQTMNYSPLFVLAKPIRMKPLLDAARSALAGRNALRLAENRP
ncbi:MAG TPA: response regulator [Candidatus Hydrogenedentes bacterium]|nr:response regulator [Candidatus Hydrogenedentota bacterium]HPC16746.1 response regulator [Candidatus Hydrogenedentota bacterium]HRT21381.1 response regulator [Candidatus Hydrogenedentota bacterium]HRT65926.1 response regulator [Candidatus Hydrogenedentota bacterium]